MRIRKTMYSQASGEWHPLCMDSPPQESRRAHSQKATDLNGAGRGFDEHMRNSFDVDRLPGCGARARLGVCLAITFRITDLGTLGGTSSYGVAINDSGQVTGTLHHGRRR